MTSHPSWLVDKWIDDLGIKKTLKLCKYNNNTPDIWFRINNITEFELIKNKVASMNLEFEAHDINNSFFKTSSSFDLIDSSLFRNGKISIQNPLNAAIVNLLDPKNDEIIIDGCI